MVRAPEVKERSQLQGQSSSTTALGLAPDNCWHLLATVSPQLPAHLSTCVRPSLSVVHHALSD